ncbi:hypothetical protein C4579_00300 [Candidatus Microgenomates bacterium]|nr:MAG: hypothetical protein C4579_00300 [Candidatus Microgenomates bacterium]
MTYVISSVVSALFFALTFFFRKQAGKYISLQAALVVEVIIELALLAIVFFLTSEEIKKGIPLDNKGIQFAALAGVAVVVGVSLNFLALKLGPLSKVTSITSPAQIIFGILIGALLLREPLTIKHIFGSILGIAGILLLTT